MKLKETITVSEFVSKIKSVVNLEPQFKNVSIVGELSNFTHHNSGHFYFSIKDKEATLSAVMFRSHAQRVKFKPKQGDKVVIMGDLDVYKATGRIQMMVRQMNLDGLGDLYAEFERLRTHLQKQGLFDVEHKKAIPLYPKKIGVITGENSAAAADMHTTLSNRWPLAKVTYYYSLVQGEFAKDALIEALEKADNDGLDVIIMARGGGSIEDLWPFNEEELVYKIFEAKTPIITGVGHESDITLVDYVADYRAATPTAASVKATPDIHQLYEDLRNYKNAMYRSTVSLLTKEKTHLENIQSKHVFKRPEAIFDRYYMALDIFNAKLSSQTNLFVQYQNKLAHYNVAFIHNINQKVAQNSLAIENFNKEIMHLIDDRLNNQKYQLSKLYQTFDLLNPFKLMQKGYAIATLEDHTLQSIEDVKLNDTIKIQLKDGTLMSKVIDIKGDKDERKI